MEILNPSNSGKSTSSNFKLPTPMIQVNSVNGNHIIGDVVYGLNDPIDISLFWEGSGNEEFLNHVTPTNTRYFMYRLVKESDNTSDPRNKEGKRFVHPSNESHALGSLFTNMGGEHHDIGGTPMPIRQSEIGINTTPNGGGIVNFNIIPQDWYSTNAGFGNDLFPISYNNWHSSIKKAPVRRNGTYNGNSKRMVIAFKMVMDDPLNVGKPLYSEMSNILVISPKLGEFSESVPLGLPAGDYYYKWEAQSIN